MRKLEQQIGSIHNLVVFEAAARHLSFSRAAEELSVTQPAVSQAIRRLEGVVGLRLFDRLHRGLALTDAGRLLFEDVGAAFDRIQTSIRHLSLRRDADHVTLLVSTAFATWWLVPRLGEFHRSHAGVDLRLETVDRDIEITRPASTIALRRGEGRWAGHDCALLAPERLVAVASPSFVARHGVPDSLEALATLPKIHLEEPHRYRPGWRDFFAANGHSWTDRGDGLRLNDYALVVQAAQAGEGVAIGWRHICDGLIGKGLLTELGPWECPTGSGFYLVWQQEANLSRQCRLVRDWMLNAAVR